MTAKQFMLPRLINRIRPPIAQIFNVTVLQRFVAGFATFSALLFLDGQLGPCTLQTRRMGAVVLFLVIAAVVISRSGLSKKSRYGGLACCLLAFGIFAVPTTSGAVLLYVCAVAFLSSCCKTSHLPRGVVEASFFYAVLGIIKGFVPEFRVVDEACCLFASRYVLITTDLRFNSTPVSIGLPALVLVVIFLLCRWRSFQRTGTLWFVFVLIATWFVALPLWVPDSSAGTMELFMSSASVSLTIVAAGIFPASVTRTSGASTYSGSVSSRKVLLIVALISAGVAGVVSAGGLLMFAPATPKILVHNRGGLDWQRPVFGRFGGFSSGMFGLLPVYSRANGFEFEVLDKDNIDRDDLSSTQILVLINSPKEWSTAEKAVIGDFISEGGSLLVLGDHTDVYGLMKGFNTLLADYGIQFNFDSAYHCRRGWRGCCTSALDTVTSKWDLEGAGVAIGASLELSGAARPLLVGRYSHSDQGVAHNTVGSFLGNYSLDGGEKTGNLPLVAMANHGQGRVIVWGDTSPFQGAGTYSFTRTVGPIFKLLSRKTQVSERPFFRRATAIILVFVLVVALLEAGSAWVIASLCTVLFVGYQGATLLNEIVLDSPVRISNDCFLIDHSQFPATGHYNAKVNPVGPLHTCLLRSGLRVARLEEWSPEKIRQARGIAFIAPQKTFSVQQVHELLDFEKSGGVVIVAVGHPDGAACKPLLTAHGVSIAPEPLGTIPAGSERRNREVPRFIDAYPIVGANGDSVSANPSISILYEVGGDVTSAFCSHGDGGLLLFADTRFFSGMNVEQASTYREGNLAFIHDVFRKYLRVAPQSVEPLFRSPKKPE